MEPAPGAFAAGLMGCRDRWHAIAEVESQDEASGSRLQAIPWIAYGASNHERSYISRERSTASAAMRVPVPMRRDRGDPTASPIDEERITMVKAMRGSGGASSLVIGLATAVLTVALPSSGGTRWASVPILAGVRPLVGTIGAGPASATPVTRPIGGSWVATTTSDRFVRLEDLRPDGRRQDERHLRKREWYRHWDNRLDFWDPGHGRKVFVG